MVSTRRLPLRSIALLVVNLGSIACSAESPGPEPRTGSPMGSASGGSGANGSTNTGGSGNSSGGAAANGNSSGGSASNTGFDFMGGVGKPVTGGPVALHPEIPETCDGKDNDENGIVDDLDVGNDGVCDCLRIATLGKPGTAGVGDVFATWLASRSVSGAVDLGSTVLTPQVLEPFQVIVSQNVKDIGRAYAPAEVQALNDWIKAGGGLMTMIGYAEPDEIVNVNSLLAPVGMRYGAEQILSSGGFTAPVSTWQMHAVTTGITSIGIDNGYPVAGTGTTLASQAGHDVLKVQEVALGRVLVWGDEWITFNSEWVDHKDYQVEAFWLNMIKWLTPTKECQVPIPPITIK